MNDKPNKRRTRRICYTLISLLAVWLLYDEAMNLMAWDFARETCKDNPNLNVVPVSLPDKSVASLNGMQIKQFEYSLQVPWSDADLDRDGKLVMLRRFKSGAVLMLFDPLTAADEVRLLRGTTQEQAKKITQIFGSRALSSNYDLMAAELAATPAQVKWWSTRTTNARSLVLLNLKAMQILDSKAIYLQSSEEMHGFQFGNPAVPPYKVELDLYDRNDRRYKILILTKGQTHQVLTQGEINAMVGSLRPIPHS